MNNCKNQIISILIIIAIMVPSLAVVVDASPDGISYKKELDVITITTEHITIKINEISPHFIWWNSNRTSSNEMYNVKFISIKEFFGDDDVLDSPIEFGGISYDLDSSEWTHEITMNDDSLTIVLTLSGLANGAEIQFIINIFNEDQVIKGTDHVVDALSEMKFDIVINNWEFSENAAGLAILIHVFESQQFHEMQIRDGTIIENGNATQTMQFESEGHDNNKIAFFEWATFAEIYDGFDLVNNISVKKASLVGGGLPVTLPVSSDLIPVYLTYGNYGNSLKMVHDPSIGVYPENYTISLNALPIVSEIIALVALVAIIITRKRKQVFERK
ncbi:MAG: hypothetical protein ACTSPM_02790 [Candidatus Heimdallarchaeota archaeon]